MKPLYKTTICIWTDEDPSEMELVNLAQEATDGLAYCSKQHSVRVEHPDNDKDWDGTEFFMDDETEGEEEEESITQG